MSKVKVVIHRNEYTIAGEESQEDIVKVASFVDEKMNDLDQKANGTLAEYALATLTAVNISNSYFKLQDELAETKKIAEQLEGDTQKYMQACDEAKRNFQECKEENLAIQREKEELEHKLQFKEQEIAKIIQGQSSIDEEIDKRLSQKLSEAEAKYKDLESNFFDVQMENVRIKSELEKLRGQNK